MNIFKTALKLFLHRGSMRSFSQFGEDAVVGAMMRKKEGFYIDVGAYDPVLYSNTYAFYKRGWKGVVIDPNGAMRLPYKIFRPRDVFVECGIGAPATATYYRFVDGAYNTFDKTQAEQVKSTKLSPLTLAIRPLKDIVAEQKVKRIDMLSIDAEGMDMQVLESHDWNVPPEVIIVESHAESAVTPFLTQKGYSLVSQVGLSLIFRRNVPAS